ncbi:MAG: TerC family protein [Deltaproteobacteria bacterium]|nr:TerC family protein [Deltaproteobacteria bacterium]
MSITGETLVSLAALAGLEIVLGIDNIVFIAIMVERLPPVERRLAYRLGLGAALISRLALLFTLSWMMKLTRPLFEVMGRGLSGRDLILLLGGIFLVFKSSREIFEKVEHTAEERREAASGKSNLTATVLQIMLVDIVFSLDSVITAVGIANQLWVMATAMVLAVLVMMLFAGAVGDFVNRNPSMQILALSFLLLIGVLLVAEGFGQHVSKGYVYSAMGFSMMVELAQLRRRKKALARIDTKPATD